MDKSKLLYISSTSSSRNQPTEEFAGEEADGCAADAEAAAAAGSMMSEKSSSNPGNDRVRISSKSSSSVICLNVR
jgi:hypothetical protein